MSVIGSSDLIGRAPGGRKLIAVVYADMVGYSRLIGLDDIGTLDLLLDNVGKAITSLRTARAIYPWIDRIHWLLAAALALDGAADEAGAALRQACEMQPDVVSQVVGLLRRASPEFVALFDKTVYAGLRRAGLPNIWAETNERPAGWIGLTDTHG
jgi:hypothetical protein